MQNCKSEISLLYQKRKKNCDMNKQIIKVCYTYMYTQMAFYILNILGIKCGRSWHVFDTYQNRNNTHYIVKMFYILWVFSLTKNNLKKIYIPYGNNNYKKITLDN